MLTILTVTGLSPLMAELYKPLDDDPAYGEGIPAITCAGDGVVSRDGRTNRESGGHVVLVSSGQERAGSSSAVGRASKVHGARERGLIIDAAPHEVGTSSLAAGRNWANGYKTNRAGEVVGFVATLLQSIALLTGCFSQAPI